MIQTTESSVVGRSRRFTAAGCGLAAAACVLALTGSLRAQTQSNAIGDASIQPSGSGNGAGVVNPTSGSTTQYLVTTENATPSHDGGTVSGTSAVPATTLANFAYLDPATVAYNSSNPGTEGSAIAFSFTITSTVYNKILFNYNFATAEDVTGGFNADFAFYSLTRVDANGNALAAATFGLLGSAADGIAAFTLVNDPAGTSPFSYTEGYKTFTSNGLATGQYILNIGVADASTFDTQSGVFIGTVAIVPEPGTTALLSLAAVGLVLGLRRRLVASAS